MGAHTTALIQNEEVSQLASAAGLFDIANGMTVRISPKDVAFPNIDLTAHLFAQPRGDWIGFDTTVSFGPAGLGLTSSVIRDTHGPIGNDAADAHHPPPLNPAHRERPAANHPTRRADGR